MNTVEPIRDLELIKDFGTELLKTGYRNFLLFQLGIDTGLRISDILPLKVKDVKGLSIKLREKKTGKIKDFEINPELKKDVTAKEIALYSTLEVVLEMYLRGYSMSGVDLNLLLVTRLRWHPDYKHVVVPPFNVIDGLGDAVAETIVAARDEHPFISQEDLSNRSRISGTLLKKLEDLGSLKGLQKENQLSLF